MKKKLANLFTVCFLILMTVMFAAFPSSTADAVRTAAGNCLNIIIPSLFAMTVLSDMLIKSGLYARCGRLSELIAKYIFRIPPHMMNVFLVSSVCGYPIGASLISAAEKDGSIGREEAEKLLCMCFGAGPAFIYGAVAKGVFGSAAAGHLIFISAVLSNILIGLFFAAGKKIPDCTKTDTPIKFSPQLFCECVAEGGKKILKMCGIIIFVSAILAIPETLGITAALSSALGKVFSCDPYYVSVFLRSAADVTNIACMKTDSTDFLPFAAALISFGGISVFMQIKSLCGNRLKTGRLIIARIYAAISSYFICDILYSILHKKIAVSAMKQLTEIRHNSPIPSLFLLIMTILLLSQKTIVKSKKICYNKNKKV